MGLTGCNGTQQEKHNSSTQIIETAPTDEITTSSIATPIPPSIEQITLYKYITEEKWTEAKKYTSDITSHNVADLELLKSYIEIRIEFADLSNSNDELKLYEPILAKINKLKLEDYSGEFKDQTTKFVEVFQKERNDYYNSLAEINEALKVKENKKLELVTWNKIENAINQGDFNTVISETVMLKDTNKDFSALYNFAESVVSGQDGDDDMMFYYLNEIPIDYNGKFSDVILEQKLQMKNKEEWKEDYLNQKKYKSVKSTSEKEAESTLPSPSIGMTADEVINSKWGTPKDVNKTITEYRVSEQWVYSNYRYIYLEDGIVTAIQY